MSLRFPRNRHVHEKIRQTLQRLREDHFVEFLGHGRYRLDSSFEDLEFEPLIPGQSGFEIPQIAKVVRTIRIRNTLLATELKRRYKFHCQVCGETVELPNGQYAEAHHIRPLGSPHLGRDVEGNILVLCPNHHVMLDRGAIAIDPESFLVGHIHDQFDPRPLRLESWHKIDQPSLLYYQSEIYGR
ncbi:MAG: HNH endonuclease [Candidatus Omnitrophica bacterium]|nr:HNH endonuclease [Candidatus Omnitrophota bacterium]